jgi:hypothetical protein
MTDQPPQVYAAIAAVMADMAKEGISKASKNTQQGYADQWVTWRYEKEGKPVSKDTEGATKIPYNARTGHKASSTNANTWTSFAEAEGRKARKHSGVGFVFSEHDPFTGIDLDDCIDPDGSLQPWALDIVTTMDSYTEVSPSGTASRYGWKAKFHLLSRRRRSRCTSRRGTSRSQASTTTARQRPSAMSTGRFLGSTIRSRKKRPRLHLSTPHMPRLAMNMHSRGRAASSLPPFAWLCRLPTG